MREDTGRLAFLVAVGILLSRLVGLVRLRVFSHYFGLRSDAADAFNAAFRIPNFLQNLFGEGALSASFIPVYARLLAEGDEEEAGKVAGAVGALLALLVSLLCLVGVLVTPWLIDIIAPGFSGPKRDLTIALVRIFFPGAGLLVLSAWCLGILNSHRKECNMRGPAREEGCASSSFWRALQSFQVGACACVGERAGQWASVRDTDSFCNPACATPADPSRFPIRTRS